MSFLRLLGSKQSLTLPMAASQVNGQREQQQQQQPANKISENAETARCLTPFSHPEQGSSISSQNILKTQKHKGLRAKTGSQMHSVQTSFQR